MVELVISSVIHREDQDFEDQIKKFNTKLQNFCKGKGTWFINTNNIINGTCLNRSQLHVNKSGTNPSVNNFSKKLKSASYYNGSDGDVYDVYNFMIISLQLRSQIGII